MAYCSANDIRRAIAQQVGGGVTNTPADLDDETLDDQAEEASAIVDSFIDGPYDPETDIIPAIIRYWTRDVGAYLASLVYRGAKAPATGDPITLRFNNAMDMLKGVADGTITIMGPENPEDQPAVVNPPQLDFGDLFGPEDFDLTGRSQTPYGGWRVFIYGGSIYWSAEEAASS